MYLLSGSIACFSMHSPLFLLPTPISFIMHLGSALSALIKGTVHPAHHLNLFMVWGFMLGFCLLLYEFLLIPAFDFLLAVRAYICLLRIKPHCIQCGLLPGKHISGMVAGFVPVFPKVSAFPCLDLEKGLESSRCCSRVSSQIPEGGRPPLCGWGCTSSSQCKMRALCHQTRCVPIPTPCK